MPRLSDFVPKYRKHKASGLAFVELNGARHYLGPHGTKTSKVAYDRLVGKWLVAGRQPPASLDNLCVVELCIRYRRFAITYYVKNGKPTCLHRVKQAIKTVRQRYGREPAAAFGSVALKAVREELIARGLSRRYINELVDCIRRMFKWGAAEQLLPACVPQALSTVAGLRRGTTAARETAPVEPVSESVVAATLPILPQVVNDMIMLQRLSGMRPQESRSTN